MVLFGIGLVVLILHDALTTAFARWRAARGLNLDRAIHVLLWRSWRACAGHLHQPEVFLSWYGPVSMLLLLSAWAAGLVIGAVLLRSSGAPSLLVLAALLCPVYLCLVACYVPALYRCFLLSEAASAQFAIEAGIPPTGVALLCRHAWGCDNGAWPEPLQAWDGQMAALLASHRAYPSLAFYRSRHRSHSWLAMLTAILDSGAVAAAYAGAAPGSSARQAFERACLAVGELCLIHGVSSRLPLCDRLPPADLARLRSILADAGIPFLEQDEAARRLAEVRGLYEPGVMVLAAHCALALSPWIPDAPAASIGWRQEGVGQA